MSISTTSRSKSRFNYYATTEQFEVGLAMGKTRWNDTWRYFVGLELGFVVFWIYFGRK